jgi:WD40 repeat protein
MNLSNASLEQIQLLSSGCQIWHRNVLAASPSGNLVAYASTLGICVFDISAKPISLKRVLGQNENSAKTLDNIVCIEWHPTDEDVLVSTSEVDIVLWSLSAPRACQSTTSLPKPIVRISWCIHDTSIIAVSCINARVYEWKVGTVIFKQLFARLSTVKSDDKSCDGANVATALAWHPKQPYLLSGLMNGGCVVYDSSNGSLVLAKDSKSIHTTKSVVDLSWEKLGGSYGLVAYKRYFFRS